MAKSFTQWIEASFGNRTMRPGQAARAGLSEIEPPEAGLRRFIKKPSDPTDDELEDSLPSTPSWRRKPSSINVPDANTTSDSNDNQNQISQLNKIVSSLSSDQLNKLIAMANQMNMSSRYPGGPLNPVKLPASEENY